MCALAPKYHPPRRTLLGLMHLGVAFASGVLRRTGRVDDRCVNDGAGADTDALAFQVMVHRVQHLTAQIVLLKQVAEAKDGRLVRRRGYSKVNSCEAAKHRRLIEGFFHARIRQAESLLSATADTSEA